MKKYVLIYEVKNKKEELALASLIVAIKHNSGLKAKRILKGVENGR